MSNEKNDNLCPNKELCGSCSWSHIPYSKQLKQKISDINGSLALNSLPDYCTEIVPAPKTNNYRNRMDFVIDFQGKVGLRQKGKWWSVIDAHPCFISDEKIEKAFWQGRSWTTESGLSFFDRKKHTGLLRYLVIRATLSGETMITVISSSPSDEEEKVKLVYAAKELARITEAISFNIGYSTTISDVSRGDIIESVQGNPWITEKIGGYYYRINPNDFFQTNSSAAEKLQVSVMDLVKEIKPSVCLDLFCGSGFFTIPLADLVQNPIGVELVPEAVATAITNAEINNKVVEFKTAKTEDYPWMNHNPDTIILDPPRAGLHDRTIEEIKKYSPKNIIYVSCNYKALARELAILADHYTVKSMKAIDMFPHTPHVEVVSHLELKAN